MFLTQLSIYIALDRRQLVHAGLKARSFTQRREQLARGNMGYTAKDIL